mgnify:CR=1 FL=1
MILAKAAANVLPFQSATVVGKDSTIAVESRKRFVIRRTIAVTGRRRKIVHCQNTRLRRSGSRLGYPPSGVTDVTEVRIGSTHVLSDGRIQPKHHRRCFGSVRSISHC